MANLFQALGANANNLGNMQNLVKQFQQFKQTFRGNPQQQVQQMLASGKISQEQYNNAVEMAKQLQSLLK